MGEMEEKLAAMMNDPQVMEQVAAMAKSLGMEMPSSEQPAAAASSGFAGLDISALQKLSSLAGRGNLDGKEHALLKALHPYLAKERLERLEKALCTARMAQMAAEMLGGERHV
ncbi:MAG TPA: hypothetical protein IAC31_09885 [Candidatus Faecousia intestinigallinarum]|nr:hypothetical protein [Candidatus Faecousia intestinigallinarum]